MPCYATVPLLLRWYYIVYAAHNAPAPTIYDIWYSIYQVDEFPRIVKFQNLPKQVGKQCSQGTLGEGEAKRKGTRRPLQWPGRKPRHRQKFAWRKLPSPSATPSTESWPKRCMQSRSPSWPEGWRVDDGWRVTGTGWCLHCHSELQVSHSQQGITVKSWNRCASVSLHRNLKQVYRTLQLSGKQG